MELEFVLTSFGLNLIIFYASISYIEDRLCRVHQVLGELKMADNIINSNLLNLQKRVNDIKNPDTTWLLGSDEEEEEEEEED